MSLFQALIAQKKAHQINLGLSDTTTSTTTPSEVLQGIQKTIIGTATESSSTYPNYHTVVSFELDESEFYTALVNRITVANRQYETSSSTPMPTVDIQVRYESAGGDNVALIYSLNDKQTTMVLPYNPQLRLSGQSNKISVLMRVFANDDGDVTARITGEIQLYQVLAFKGENRWLLVS